MPAYKIWNRLNNQSISAKLYLVVGIMALFITIELAVLWFSLDTLSSVRAYVCGESLWSKSQKNAVFYLIEYADKGNKEDYTRFRTFLNQPLGDRQGRLELEKENPDYDIVRQGFLKGGNHPQDIEGMINVFERFRKIYYIDKAISIWAQADPYILQLISLGNHIEKEYSMPEPSRLKIDSYAITIRPINDKLTVLEEEFSYTLGEGTRWLEGVVLNTLIITAFTAEIFCLILIASVSKRITRSVDEIIRVSRQVSKGNFTDRATIFANDEIGLLADSFNLMVSDTGENIEELKRAERAIREREEQLKVIFRSAPDGVVVTDEEGNIIIWNPKAEQIFGWKREEVIGSGFIQLIKPQDLDDKNPAAGMSLFLQDIPTEEQTISIETIAEKRDGQSVNISLSIAITTLSAGKLLVCFIKDITENKKAASELEAETLYVKLLQSIAIAANEASTLNEAGQFSLDEICRLIQWPVGHMFIKTKQQLLVSSKLWNSTDQKAYRILKKDMEDMSFSIGEGLVGLVAQHMKPFWISDISQHPECKCGVAALACGLQSAFAFPIIIKSDVIAVLVFFSPQLQDPDNQLLDVLSTIGKQLGRVVERQRANEAIRTSEEKLRALTETAIDSIISINSSGNIIYFNLGAEKTFGYQSSEVMGKSLTMLMPENMRALHNHGLERYNQTKEAHVIGKSVELVGLRKDGTLFPIELNLSTWSAQGERFYTGVIRDITERKAKDAELMKLSAVASFTDNAILITDRTGKVEWVNDGFTRLSGYNLEDFNVDTNEKFGQIIDAQTLETLILSKTPVSYEVKNLTKNGEEYWVMATLTPITDAKGEVQNIIAIDSDISKLKHTEEALIKAKQKAEDSEKAKEMFLANMSHEIRTPMNAIIGFTRLMKDTKLNAEQRDWLKTIESSGENLMVIINDILDLSKIQAGKLELEETEMVIAKLVQSTVNMLDPKCQEKGINISYTIDQNVPVVLLGDSVRITQALLNLLSNAVKFTHKGGVVCKVHVAGETDNYTSLLFEVSDTGIGIPKDKLGLIFESFSQVSTSTTRKYGGTGLGLTITQKIIEQQGGEIKVVSKLNEGSTFSFTIPLKKAKSTTKVKIKEEENTLPEHLNGMRILLVEDNLINQKLAKTTLEKWHANVTIAGNGKIALNILEEKQFDLILMDLQMPEMDGYETTAHIRKNTSLAGIPIIAMTADALKGEAEKCIQAGMNDYISKPFSHHDLLSKIGMHVSVKLPASIPAETTSEEYSLEYLKELGDDNPEFMTEIIQTFLQDTPPQLELLQHCCHENDWNGVRLASHKLKTSVGFFGMKEAALILSRLEEYASSQTNINKIEGLINIVCSKCALTFVQLKQELLALQENNHH